MQSGMLPPYLLSLSPSLQVRLGMAVIMLNFTWALCSWKVTTVQISSPHPFVFCEIAHYKEYELDKTHGRLLCLPVTKATHGHYKSYYLSSK